MKLGAVYCIYHEPEYLEISVEPIHRHFDRVVFLVSKKPWNGPVFDNSETLARIRALCQKYAHFELIIGDWDNQPDQRNYGLQCLEERGFTHAFIIDSDEIYHEHELGNIKKYIEHHEAVAAFHVQWNTYWKKDYYVIEPREAFCPLIAVRLGEFVFTEKRGGTTSVTRTDHGLVPKDGDARYNAVIIPPQVALCHHLSYARTDDFMQSKIQSISAAPEISKSWYQDVWASWTPDRCDLHPVTPKDFRQAVAADFALLPQQLQHLIKREKLRTRNCLMILVHDEADLDIDVAMKRFFASMPPTSVQPKIVLVNFVETQVLTSNLAGDVRLSRVISGHMDQRARAFNQALEGYAQHDVCFYNLSCHPSSGWLNHLYEILSSIPSAGVVAPTGLTSKGGYQSHDFVKETSTAMFAAEHCALILCEVFQKIGGFDAQLPSKGLAVQADFMQRVALAGFQICLTPGVSVLYQDRAGHYDSPFPVMAAMQIPEFFAKTMRLLTVYASRINLWGQPALAKSLGLKLP